MAQTLQKLAGIIENELLPVFDNQIGYEPSPFVEKIQKVTLTAPGISANTPVGANGGVGYGAENSDIPESGAQMYERFKISPVDLFGTLEISDKALKLGVGDSSINLMIDQTESIKKTMGFIMGRSIIAGNGTGKVCTVNAAAAADTFTVSDTNGLVEGMKIDFIADGASAPTSATAKKRIKSIDRVNNTITVDGDKFDVSKGFITYQGSYNKEICGIGAFFDDTIPSVYGIDKNDKSWIKPEVDELAGGDLDHKLNRLVQNSEWYKGGKIDMMLVGADAYDEYIDYLKATKMITDNRQHFKGGVAAIEVLFGNRSIAFVKERHMAADEILGVDTSAFKLCKTPIAFLKEDDASAFQKKPNSTIYQAVIGTYLNLICKNPGSCFKLKGVTRT